MTKKNSTEWYNLIAMREQQREFSIIVQFFLVAATMLTSYTIEIL